MADLNTRKKRFLIILMLLVYYRIPPFDDGSQRLSRVLDATVRHPG